MEKAQYLEVVRTEAARLAAAARAAGADTGVPTCPDWKVADLLGHVTGVHGWVRQIVAEGLLERPGRDDQPRLKDGEDLVEVFEAGAAAVVEALDAVAGDDLVWNWFDRGPAPAAFWFRRMAHETVIHRVDAESAAGWPSVVEPAGLAIDGIDEYLHFVPVRAKWQPDSPMAALRGSYHFHATDTHGEWLVAFTDDGIAVSREHAKGDVAVRGPAGALELSLYNRGSRPFAQAIGLEVHGDPARLDAWTQAVRF